MKDYEKKYKAVLETATQWIKDGCTDKEKICLECVFPELKESEDERIRKWIKEKLESGILNLCPGMDGMISDAQREPYKKAIAWLEKQKESHSLVDAIVPGKPYLPPISRPTIAEEQKLASISCGHENDSNHAEWSEEDEKMRDDTISAFQLAYPYALENENPRRKNIDWLKSLRPQPHWKPSAEQMDTLKLVVYNRPVGSHELDILESLYNYLKKL